MLRMCVLTVLGARRRFRASVSRVVRARHRMFTAQLVGGGPSGGTIRVALVYYRG
jgi:hypothetical protein